MLKCNISSFLFVCTFWLPFYNSARSLVVIVTQFTILNVFSFILWMFHKVELYCCLSKSMLKEHGCKYSYIEILTCLSGPWAGMQQAFTEHHLLPWGRLSQESLLLELTLSSIITCSLLVHNNESFITSVPKIFYIYIVGSHNHENSTIWQDGLYFSSIIFLRLESYTTYLMLQDSIVSWFTLSFKNFIFDIKYKFVDFLLLKVM